jgi:deoxyribonuclease-4
MRVGCHVSIAGGIYNAPKHAADSGCEVFQIFLRSPQGGAAPDFTPGIIKQFTDSTVEHHQAAWVVHTPYYINYASNNPRIKHGSISVIRDELERASKIGAAYLMTHLGSGKDFSHETAQQMVVDGLAETLNNYTGSTVFCIEIAAGAGDILGSSFEEIGEYIYEVEKKDKRLKGKRGVCFDTCHAFASGYDLRTVAAVKETMLKFDKHIGFERLKVVHANDSKFGCGEKRDRHEHIGKGLIGLAGFKALAKHPILKKVDWYLETEPGGVVNDITTLKSLRAGV